MPKSSPFVDDVVLQLNIVAPVKARSMFGGHGLFSEGVMIGLIANDTLYFKVDDQNRDRYLQAESEPFIYNRNGKLIKMSYQRLPDAIFKDVEQLQSWYEASYRAALRSKAKTKSKKKH